MSQATQNRGSASSNWVLRVVVIVVLSVVVLFSAFWVLTVFGRVYGSEFSPYSFQRRVFTYVEIPLIGVQVTPVRHMVNTGDLETHLTTNKIIPAATGKRWDFISGGQGANLSPNGDAHILCLYLDARDDSEDLFWLRWTQDHPSMAKVLWPAVAEVATQQAYIFVPALMNCAKTARSPLALRRDIERVLVDKYSTLAISQQQLGRHESAVELFSGALKQDPKHRVSLQGRAKSLAKLGKQEDAKADLDKLKQLKETPNDD